MPVATGDAEAKGSSVPGRSVQHSKTLSQKGRKYVLVATWQS